MSDERRASPRYRVQRGTFAYFHSFGERTTGAIRDLSLGGVYVEDHLSSFSEDTELELELPLGEESVVLGGVVARSYPGEGFAVQFLECPPEKRSVLQKGLRRLVREELEESSPAAAGEHKGGSGEEVPAPPPAGLPRSNALRLAALIELLEERGILEPGDVARRLKEHHERHKPES